MTEKMGALEFDSICSHWLVRGSELASYLATADALYEFIRWRDSRPDPYEKILRATGFIPNSKQRKKKHARR